MRSPKIESPGRANAGGIQNTELSARNDDAAPSAVKQCDSQSDLPKADFHSVATSLTAAGISVLPVTSEKRPALRRWKDFQSQIPTTAELNDWFSAQNPHGVGIICGKVSGGLEVIDLDSKNDPSGTLNASAEAAIRELAPGLWERFVIERSRSGGLHLYFRSPNPGGNHKLARWPDNKGQLKEIAETRGEGGYVVCAPSPGYDLIQGQLDSPPMLTAEQREDLLAAVRSLDRSPPEPAQPQPSKATHTNAQTPFDDFNQRGDALGLLVRHGWAIGEELADGKRYLRRPGKTEKGCSATWNYAGRGTLSVFSSNAEPFKTAPTSYSPAAIYALLECNGDFKRAAAQLRAQGYGKAEVPSDLRERLLARKFNHASAPPKPEPRFKINGKTVCTAGNLTSISAQAKAGKSAFVGAAISAAICAALAKSGNDNLGLSAVPPEGRHLLHFDTEQSPFDADKLMRTALRRAGVEIPPDFLASFGLAGFSAPDLQAALAMQMEELANSGGAYAVIIDGVADLVLDVNDPVECNGLIAKLQALAITHDCPILCVVHENPTQDSGKMRGHLGSQLERKCESNLRLKRTKEITLVSGDKMRGAPITENEGPRFQWSQLEDMHVSTKSQAKTKECEKRERLESVAEEVFESLGETALTFSGLVAGIRKVRGVGRSTAETNVKEMRELNVVLSGVVTNCYVLNPI